jgi:hypothetical protein
VDGSMEDSGTSGVVCPDTSKYETEAVAAVASGNPTICPIPDCPLGECCYEQPSPFNVCVAE